MTMGKIGEGYTNPQAPPVYDSNREWNNVGLIDEMPKACGPVGWIKFRSVSLALGPSFMLLFSYSSLYKLEISCLL